MAELLKEAPASKKELDAAKKELLDKLVSKEEFKQVVAELATRESLEVVANEVVRLSSGMADVKGELNEIKWRMGQMEEKVTSLETKFDEKFDILLNAVDGVANKFDILITEKAAIDHALTRQDERLDTHEVRIRRLEKKIA